MNVHDLELQVLDDARRAMSPSDEDAGRVRAAVLAQIGVVATGSAAAITSASGAAGAATTASVTVSHFWVSAGVVKALVVSVIAMGGVVAVFSSTPVKNRTTALAPAIASVAASGPRETLPGSAAQAQCSATDATSALAPANSARNRLESKRQSLHRGDALVVEPQPPPPPNDAAERERLGEEVWLLKQADRALRNHQPELASKQLNELALRAPNGTLVEEREALRTLAHCMTNPSEPAALTATSFLAQHPASIYAARIRVSCHLNPATSDGTPLPRTLTKQEELP